MLVRQNNDSGQRALPGRRLSRLARSVVADPLFHFLLLGACLFGFYALVHKGKNDDPRTIVVDRPHLLTYLQYRSKAFDAKRFKAVLDNMPQKELDGLVRDYVEEEALYREAKALKLDANDYVARRRLIQQLEFVLEGFLAKDAPLSEAELTAYYEAHKSAYAVAPTVTFTHVFFDQSRHHDKTKALAEAALKTLNARSVAFSEATSYGDRFLYQVNYVQKDAGLVSSHFGAAFANAVFALPVDAHHWVGPLSSPYGEHLVLVTERTKGSIPSLDEVRARVTEDAEEARQRAKEDAAIAGVVKSYKVDVRQLRELPKAAKP